MLWLDQGIPGRGSHKEGGDNTSGEGKWNLRLGLSDSKASICNYDLGPLHSLPILSKVLNSNFSKKPCRGVSFIDAASKALAASCMPKRALPRQAALWLRNWPTLTQPRHQTSKSAGKRWCWDNRLFVWKGNRISSFCPIRP